MANSVIRNTTANSSGFASGFVSRNDAHATLDNLIFIGNEEHGVYFGTDSTGWLGESAIISTTSVVPNYVGIGLSVWDAEEVAVSETLVHDSQGAGIGVSGQDRIAEVSLFSTTVSGSRTCLDGFAVGGIQVLMGNARLEDSFIHANLGPEVSAVGEHASVALLRCEVSGPQTSVETYGPGVTIHSGAQAEISWCLVDNNVAGGISFGIHVSELTVESSVVRNTKVNTDGWRGYGVFAYQDGSATLSGVLLDRNHDTGAMLSYPDSHVEFHGSIIRDTLPDARGQFGVGVNSLWGAEGVLYRTLVAGNNSGGVVTFSGESSVSVIDSAIVGTQSGGAWIKTLGGKEEFMVWGDGLVCLDESLCASSNTLIADNGRCGIYVLDAEGDISHTTVLRNGSYGLAMERSAESVSYENAGNFFWGNCTALAPSLKVEVTDSPGDLPVPEFSSSIQLPD
jgi:hypothetical protein